MKNELKTFIKNVNIRGWNRSIKSQKYSKLYQFILKETQFLQTDNISEKIYCIINNIKQNMLCEICNNHVKFLRYSTGYMKCCSKQCSNHTNSSRVYSAKTTMSNKSIEEKVKRNNKIKTTLATKTNEEIHISNNKRKLTKFEKYGDENYCNGVQISKAWTNKSKDEINQIIQTRNNTMLERYGVENAYQLPEIQQKSKETQSRLINELINSNRELGTDYKKLAKENNIFWNLGLNETWMLDNIEHALDIKLIRQYPICGCFVDGYDKVNNICYEIDENYHRKEEQSENDKLREQKIINKLGCTFVRILDYTH